MKDTVRQKFVRIREIWRQLFSKLTFGEVNPPFYDQGPVVQSIVSLTSSLRGQLIKCLKTL